jgi:hypothetical protein
MRKDVSGGQSSRIQKNDEKRRFRRWRTQVQKFRKNDEKRHFRRLKFKKSEKMMRKDFQEVENPS